jgi:ankyrin repeat protein
VKRKFFIIITVVLILAGGTLTVFLNSNCYYSKKLISAIREENIIAVQQIIDKKPTCINTYPSITSKWWHSAMNWRVCYPLNEACGTGNIELIELLIENGADVNCNDGLTPLSITYNSKVDNWYEISQILIKDGASLDYITDYSGGESSVLQDIVQVRSGAALPGYKPESKEEVIKAFNYALENCDHSNVRWMRVLQHSVTNDRIEIVKLLLDDGYCDVNDISVGMTALMFAARSSTPEMVQLLLDYGADKSIKTSDGKTAYDYAVENGHLQIAELLEGID